MAWRETLVFLLLVLAAQGFGWAVFRLSRGKLGDGSLLWNQVLGLAGLLALAGAMSLVERLRPWPAGAALAGLAVLGLAGLLHPGGGPEPDRERFSRLEILFLAGIVFHQLIGLFQALSPPVEGEGVHALFVFARDYGRAGTVFYHPDLYASRPQNIVLLFSLAQLFAKAEAGQLMAWWLGLLSVAGLNVWGRREVGRTAGLLAGLIVSAMPVFTMISGRGMSDSGVLFFGLMGLLAVRRISLDQDRLPWAAVGGVCLGLAAGFKVVGLTVVVAGLLLAAYLAARRRLGLAGFLLLAGLILASASPWYIYSFLHTGQFFYNYGPLTGRLAESDRTRWFVQKENIDAPGGLSQNKARPDQPDEAPGTSRLKGSVSRPLIRELWSGLTAPGHNPVINAWRLNTIGDHRRRVVGPFVLILVPLVFLLRPVPAGVKWLTAAAALQFCLASIVFGPYARYALPALSLAAVAAAFAWQRLVDLKAWPKALAVAVLVLSWGPLLPEAGYAFFQHLPVATGLTGRGTFLEKMTQGEIEVYRFADKNLPEEARVLSIAEHRGYYLDRPVIYGSWERNPYLVYDRFRSSLGDPVEQFDRAVRELGVTHVLLSRRFSDNAWDLDSAQADNIVKWMKRIDRWAGERLEPLYCRGELCLYRLKAGGED